MERVLYYFSCNTKLLKLQVLYVFYGKQNGSLSIKSKGKDQEFEYNVFETCKKQKIILQQIENSQAVTALKFDTD